MRAGIGLILLLTMSLALAGCGSKGTPAAQPGPSASVAATGDPIPDAGEIVGTVIDDSHAPIPGATVGIVELSVQATTDEAGAFAITNVPPGQYRLVAAKLGYQSLARNVKVEPMETVTQQLLLTPIVVEGARQEIIGPYAGYLICGVVRPGVQGVAGATTIDCGSLSAASSVVGEWKNRFDFEMTQENLVAVVGETKWTPSAAGTTSKLQTFFSYAGGSGTHWWCSAAGPSPTRFVYAFEEEAATCHDRGSSSAEPEPTSDLTLRMQAYLPFCRVSTSNPTDLPICVTYQQRFHMMATLFYGEQPPAEFSAFPDA